MALRNRLYRSFTIILIVFAITPRVQTFTIKPKTLTVDNDWPSIGLIDDINKDTKIKEKSPQFPYETTTKNSAYLASITTAVVTDAVQAAPKNSSDLASTIPTVVTDGLQAATSTEDAKTQQSFTKNDSESSSTAVEMFSTISSTEVSTFTDVTTEDTKTSTDPALPDDSVTVATSDSTPSSTEMLTTEYSTEYTTEYTPTSSEAGTTETSSQSKSITSTPYWNKYKFIERKKVSLPSKKELYTKTPTSQTKLMETTSPEQTTSEMTSEKASEKTSEKSDSSTTDTSSTVNDDINKNKQIDNDVMSSVKTDVIDLTAASTTITDNLENASNDRSYPTIPSNIVELEEVDMSKDTKDKSRSQLVSDAINEEQLMIEESMSNREENFKKHKVQEDYSSKETTANNSLVDPEFVTKANKITADRPSAKSISGDRGKTTGLYAVNPNYKPLKKIDVQAPKPFLRNPDDNSWRNESISSLGIVFKPKNASKAFTEVLKNKTESLFNNLESENKSEEQPEDLRIRLGKIGELRKSKKKNKLGETVYTDYDSINANEFLNGPQSKEEIKKVVVQTVEPILDVKTTTETTTQKNTPPDTATKEKAKKFNIQEYYELTKHDEDEDNYYEVMPKMELKKFKTSKPPLDFKASPFQKPHDELFEGRQATIQYFPPLQRSKVVDEAKSTLPSFRREERPRVVISHNPATVPPEPSLNEEYRPFKPYEKESAIPEKDDDEDGSYFYNRQPPVTAAYELDRPAYVIKQYGNLFKNTERHEEPQVDVVPAFTVTPPVYINQQEEDKPKKNLDYDYEDQLRKDVIDKFVENFNENRELFKEDFPVLYNSSIVHQKAEKNGKVLASSNAFLKRLYTETPVNHDSSYFVRARPYDADCDKTVELSPAYELHYYVPDEEEKEEIQSKVSTSVYSYRL